MPAVTLPSSDQLAISVNGSQSVLSGELDATSSKESEFTSLFLSMNASDIHSEKHGKSVSTEKANTQSTSSEQDETLLSETATAMEAAESADDMISRLVSSREMAQTLQSKASVLNVADSDSQIGTLEDVDTTKEYHSAIAEILHSQTSSITQSDIDDVDDGNSNRKSGVSQIAKEIRSFIDLVRATPATENANNIQRTPFNSDGKAENAIDISEEETDEFSQSLLEAVDSETQFEKSEKHKITSEKKETSGVKVKNSEPMSDAFGELTSTIANSMLSVTPANQEPKTKSEASNSDLTNQDSDVSVKSRISSDLQPSSFEQKVFDKKASPANYLSTKEQDALVQNDELKQDAELSEMNLSVTEQTKQKSTTEKATGRMNELAAKQTSIDNTKSVDKNVTVTAEREIVETIQTNQGDRTVSTQNATEEVNVSGKSVPVTDKIQPQKTDVTNLAIENSDISDSLNSVVKESKDAGLIFKPASEGVTPPHSSLLEKASNHKMDAVVTQNHSGINNNADNFTSSDQTQSDQQSSQNQLLQAGTESIHVKGESSDQAFTFSLGQTSVIQQRDDMATTNVRTTPTLLQSVNVRNGELDEQMMANRVLMMVGQSLKEAELMLNPEGLGKIRVHLSLDQEQQTHVQFYAQNPNAKDIIEQSLPRLREMLTQNGVQPGQTQVQHQSSQQQGFAQQFSGQSMMQQESGGRSGQGEKGNFTSSDVQIEQTISVSTSQEDGIDFYA